MITAIGAASQWYGRFKAVVFTLLVCNAAFFLLFGTFNETLDATAWLVLLALFELETGFGGHFGERSASVAIRATRLAAAVAVGAAAVGYAYQREWLDAVNTALWIAVVVLLESEVRSPGAVARHRIWFAGTAVALYSALAALVVVWAWRGEWFDAYDAALWLTAFAIIEMDVLRISPRAATG